MTGGALDLTTLAQPRVEPEIAFRLGVDLDRTITRDEVASVVDGVAVALEIIDSRWTGYRFRLADVVADNASAAGFVVGEWRAIDLDALGARGATFAIDDVVVTTDLRRPRSSVTRWRPWSTCPGTSRPGCGPPRRARSCWPEPWPTPSRSSAAAVRGDVDGLGSAVLATR